MLGPGVSGSTGGEDFQTGDQHTHGSLVGSGKENNDFKLSHHTKIDLVFMTQGIVILHLKE